MATSKMDPSSNVTRARAALYVDCFFFGVCALASVSGAGAAVGDFASAGIFLYWISNSAFSFPFSVFFPLRTHNSINCSLFRFDSMCRFVYSRHNYCNSVSKQEKWKNEHLDLNVINNWEGFNKFWHRCVN